MLYLWTHLRVSFNAYMSILVAIQVIYRALTRRLTTGWYFIIAQWPKWIGLDDRTVFSWAGCHNAWPVVEAVCPARDGGRHRLSSGGLAPLAPSSPALPSPLSLLRGSHSEGQAWAPSSSSAGSSPGTHIGPSCCWLAWHKVGPWARAWAAVAAPGLAGPARCAIVSCACQVPTRRSGRATQRDIYRI
jgi:hypothetical protein